MIGLFLFVYESQKRESDKKEKKEKKKGHEVIRRREKIKALRKTNMKKKSLNKIN